MTTIDGITYVPINDINTACTLFLFIVILGAACMSSRGEGVFGFGFGMLLATIICGVLIFASIHVRFS